MVRLIRWNVSEVPYISDTLDLRTSPQRFSLFFLPLGMNLASAQFWMGNVDLPLHQVYILSLKLSSSEILGYASRSWLNKVDK